MKIIDIYTDGSDLGKQDKTSNRLGCGGVMIEKGVGMGKELDRFSTEFKKDRLLKEYGTSDCSNPTMEMLGVLEALKNFDIPKDADRIIFHEDYIGCMNWIEDHWKINKSYIQSIKNEIMKTIDDLGLTGKIDFAWVKGHQKKSVMDPDAYWNNIVDKLAKGHE